jgi:hypothetical protein
LLPQEFFSDYVQNFIRNLEDEDPQTIVLKNKTIGDLPASFIADQVSGRKKAREKIPAYYANRLVAYPPKVNLEQSSSETTALYKLDQIRKSGITSFRTCADLTGGFGVDSYFFSTLFDSVTYVEPNKALFDIAASNHQQLGRTNIQHANSNAYDFLSSLTETFDLIYIDPSRRVSGNQKVYTLSQSEPNVIELLPAIFSKTQSLLIKASPLLDIQLALKELQSVVRVVVVAVNNDCKELLFFANEEKKEEPLVHTINIRASSAQTFDFRFTHEQRAEPSFSDVMSYLYEPNAAIMKAGAFKSVASNFGLEKMHKNTHIYTSKNMLADFPGRIFKVIAQVKPNPIDLKNYFTDGKANIISRNYPLSVDELRKKTKLSEGGERYLIAFSGASKKFTVVAERLN